MGEILQEKPNDYDVNMYIIFVSITKLYDFV